jgi:ferric-dicitrate binding protein FerR (iron transport regulator)
MDGGRFSLLLEHFRSGETTPAESAELEQLLRRDPALRRTFAREFLLEVQLRRAFAGVPLPLPAKSIKRRRFRTILPWAAAAVLLVGIGLGLALWLGRPAPDTDTGTPVEVVEKKPEDAVFQVAASDPRTFHLEDGSLAVLNPLSKGVFHGRRGEVRQSVELEQGSGTFHVARGPGRFQVQTSVGTVTALGTEFSVELHARKKRERKRGRAERVTMTVSVKEGSVRVEVGSRSVVLKAGEMREFRNKPRREEDDD